MISCPEFGKAQVADHCMSMLRPLATSLFTKYASVFMRKLFTEDMMSEGICRTAVLVCCEGM
jgi:hypothetical protein